MENSSNSTPNQNDTPKPNPNANSIDGFSRPTPPAPSNDAVVSSISIAPSEPDTSESNQDSPNNPEPQPESPTLSAPITSGDMDNKKSKIWTAILVVLLLIVFVGGLYGIYAYQQKKINTANSQINALTAQNAILKTQVSKLQSAPSVSVTTQSTTTSQTTFKIPELGVSFSVPYSIADITYTLTSSNTQANLYTTNLASLDPACKATATVAPLGSVVKATGTYPTSPSANMTLIKQYPTYYIAYLKPASACSTNTQVNTFANTQMTAFKGSFTTIATISS